MENKTIDKIDLLIENFMKESGIPGVAVGIIENNEPVYAKGFGVKNADTNEPVTETTLFHMASVSKLFVATAIMQLVEQEKINLDDAVIKYLPYFKVQGKGYETITIREMLSHISGMPDIYDYEWDKPQYDEGALERHVKNAAELELIEGQRGKFKYSNLAFEVLGDLISKVSGMSFEGYIKEKILNPLGMKESTFLNKEVNKELLATPHRLSLQKGYKARISEVFPYNRRHAPSSTLCSNIVEMFKWAEVNLNKGTIDGVQILKKESYSELFNIAAPTVWTGFNSHVGLSWFIGEYKGAKIFSHSGGDTGFLSYFLIIPEKHMGIVWMTNNDFAPMRILTNGLLDIILGCEEEIKYPLALTLVKTIADNGLQAAEDKYNYIVENCKHNYQIEENDFNRFAYGLCGENRVHEAIKLLQIAISELPKAANLYDSLGEMYLKINNKEMAIKNYQRAVELNPHNQAAVKLLKELNFK